MTGETCKGLKPDLLGCTFHIEATESRGITREVIQKIRDAGMHVGLALSPPTPVEQVLPYCDLVDLVLVMTVNPGLGGQKFMNECLSKVKTIRELHPKLNVEVDGGVKPGESVMACAQAGANVIVSGSGVFMAKDPKKAIQELRQAVADAAL